MSAEQRMIPCSQAVRELWDYLDQRLSPEEHAEVERHLAFCRRCCGEMEFAKELQRFLATQGSDEIPPDVKAHLERIVEDL
jgi:anti-sigma factor (TIGR02949 family)